MGAGQSTETPPEIPSHIQAPTIPAEQIAERELTALSSNVDAVGGLEALNASVLERIAKAAGELKNNEFADRLIDTMKEQEKTWQAKFQAETEEQRVNIEREKQNAIIRSQEEQRRTMEQMAQQEQQKAEYEDRLARQRYQDQLQQNEQANQRERQQQMALTQQQEQERRRTMEYQAQLDRETEQVKAVAEGKARAQAERENKDIRNEQLLLRAEQDRIIALDSIREAGKVIGDGVSEFLQDPHKVASTVGVVTALAAGVYFSRSAATVTAKYVGDRIGKPTLVRDTSRTSFLTSPLASVRRMFSSSNPDSVLSGVVLEPKLEQRMGDFTVATAHTRRHGANFRNIMLYGPPGTGKTLFATKLAKQSGLDYAILAGGDVAPLGADAVTEMHKVLDWAQTSKKGMLLFVDEADAFLRKRGDSGDGHMTENMRNVLSTFLYRTGTPSDKVMIAMATNEPKAIDSAVLDRMDEAVEFALPQIAERKRLVKQYFEDLIVAPQGSAQKIRLDDSLAGDADGNNNKLEDFYKHIAKETEGFSGRHITKLVTAWQAAAYASIDNTLTMTMINDTMAIQKAQQQMKDSWIN